MTSEEFITRLRVAVHESAVRVSVSWLEKPPGRHPSEAMLKLSQWYNGLPPEDKHRIRQTLEMAVGHAVFEMLTLIDGDKSIREPGEPLGQLELRYRVGGQTIILNDPAAAPLHDLFAEQVPPP